jgi:phosphoglycerate dehydrogenase-like enzyme
VKAVVTAEFPARALDRLRELGYEPFVCGWGVTRQALTGPELIAVLEDAELLICELERVDDAVLEAAPRLRLIAACRGEPTNVDLAAATSRGIPVLHTPGRNADSVADFVIGLMLMEARSIARAERHLRADGWNVDGELPYFHFRGPELAGRTLGLVGFGAVGRQVAARAAGFDMLVLVYDPYVPVVPAPYEKSPLEQLLRRCDFLSIHCPPTPETTGMIGRRELELMRAPAYLINTARAAVVDEQALVDALRARAIAGAALDVFWEEPIPRDHPLLTLENVTLTPHVAGAADDVKEHHAAIVLEDLRRWQRGDRPLHLANLQVWRAEEGAAT